MQHFEMQIDKNLNKAINVSSVFMQFFLSKNTLFRHHTVKC